MKLHQLTTEKKFNVKCRELSFFCQNEGRCDCHNPYIHSFEDESTNTENITQYILDEATGDMRVCSPLLELEYSIDKEDNYMMDVDETDFTAMDVDEYVNDDLIQPIKLFKSKKRRHSDSNDENSEAYSVHDTSEGSFQSEDFLQDCDDETSDKEIEEHEKEQEEEQEEEQKEKQEEQKEEQEEDQEVKREKREGKQEEEQEIGRKKELKRKGERELDNEHREKEEKGEDGSYGKQTIDVCSYVLVKFQLEKRTKYYVGQVLEVYGNHSYKVKFLRNKGKGKFAWPINDDISLVDKDDVVNIVPKLIHERRGIKTLNISNCNFVIG
ncbi:hypothetical protein O0L34_g17819 [Tuta absoluta]|nr:hypothetical protein O0L34_g17819 [Tuta absoluta]